MGSRQINQIEDKLIRLKSRSMHYGEHGIGKSLGEGGQREARERGGCAAGGLAQPASRTLPRPLSRSAV